MPILAALEASASATALLMFPTKALAQDQRTSLKGMLAAALGPGAEEMVEASDTCRGAWGYGRVISSWEPPYTPPLGPHTHTARSSVPFLVYARDDASC